MTHGVPTPPPLAITERQRAVLNNADTHLQVLRGLAEVRGLAAAHVTLLSIDVEIYEMGSEILEVGLASISAGATWADPDIFPRPAVAARHLIAADYQHLRNGRHVADKRDAFHFGDSEMMADEALRATILSILADMERDNGRVVLVGHTIEQDVRWLKGIGVKRDFSLCDIGKAYQAQHSRIQMTSLEGMMEALGIDGRDLHNGEMTPSTAWRCYCT